MNPYAQARGRFSSRLAPVASSRASLASCVGIGALGLLGGARNLGENWAYGVILRPNGDRFVSAGGGYQLWLPGDGNLAIDDTANGFGNPGHPQWRASDLGFQPIANPGFAWLSPQGAIEIFDSNGRKVWSNGVSVNIAQAARGGMLLQTDGNLVLYDARGVSGGGAVWASQPGLSHSFLGLNTALDLVDKAANLALVPAWNLQTFWITGKSPADAFAEDFSNFKQAAANASKVSGVSPQQAAGQITDQAGNLAPPALRQTFEDVTNGDAAAAFGSYASATGTTPAALLSDVAGSAYAQAWSLATNNGAVYSPTLPAPPGRRYAASTTIPKGPSSGSSTSSGGGFATFLIVAGVSVAAGLALDVARGKKYTRKIKRALGMRG